MATAAAKADTFLEPATGVWSSAGATTGRWSPSPARADFTYLASLGGLNSSATQVNSTASSQAAQHG